MAKSTKTHKMTNLKIPAPKMPNIEKKRTLPNNGLPVTEESLSFSFSCFDRSHKLFNLGSNTGDAISGNWFLDLLDCFRSVNNQTIPQLKQSMHDLHPIDWNYTNTTPPQNSEQLEYWQFRLNKSKGRVVGFKILNIFYVVWLDPYHNLTDSEGYGTATYYKHPLSEYEKSCQTISALKKRIKELEEELQIANDLLDAKEN